MTTKKSLPVKCEECAKSISARIHGACHFCRDLEFHESILCDLNRFVQDEAGFECHAFQPILKLVAPSKIHIPGKSDGLSTDSKKKAFLNLLSSDKIKYEKALALQQLSRDPDGVYVRLKYHIAWSVVRRIPVFNPPNHFVDLAKDVFCGCSEKVGGFVYLLSLAPDHLHLYVDSDGELSIEEMVQRMKRISNNALMEKFPLLSENLGGNTEIWDDAYFVETVG